MNVNFARVLQDSNLDRQGNSTNIELSALSSILNAVGQLDDGETASDYSASYAYVRSRLSGLGVAPYFLSVFDKAVAGRLRFHASH